MPQTKFQDVIFTLIMVLFMVYAMVTYNVYLNTGEMSMKLFIMGFKEIPIMMVIAFIAEFFLIGKLTKYFTFKSLDVKKTQPMFITLMISALTVCFMCPLMSLIATLLFADYSWGTFVVLWFKTIIINFPMAFFYQIFFAGPIVRKIFRTIFKVKA